MPALTGLSWAYIAAPLAIIVLIAVFVVVKRRRCPDGENLLDASQSLASQFIIFPYLQLGDRPALSDEESVEVWWHATHDRRWHVQWKLAEETCWRAVIKSEKTVCDIPGLGKHLQLSALITGLPPGALFDYRIIADGAVAFAASGKARTHSDKFTFAVPADIGELGMENNAELKVAHQLFQTRPDVIVIDGDIAYPAGRVKDYMRNVFPAYNAPQSSTAHGAPLLRSVITMPVPGNHDMGMPNVRLRPDFSRDPDALGYFLFWSPPLNGPVKQPDAGTPPIQGDEKARYRFAVNAGDRFPRAGMYSFDWGNAHFTVLDSNAYVDWTDAELRAWVAADLARNQKKTWRFVMMHHPPFSSHRNHRTEQRTRLLADLFRRCNVDVVFCGHNHCYERTRPLRFKENKLELQVMSEDCPVEGTMEIDSQFDGVKNVKPNGVIYIGCGASGAAYNPAHKPNADQIKPFTAFFDQSVHSFTHVAIDGGRFELRQIDENGAVIDRFVIEK